MLTCDVTDKQMQIPTNHCLVKIGLLNIKPGFLKKVKKARVDQLADSNESAINTWQYILDRVLNDKYFQL